MKDPKIAAIKAREILDNRGRPMLEVDVWTSNGDMGRGAAPAGTSVGKHEAVVLRDKAKRYGGFGVLKAVNNITEIIAPALIGKTVTLQRELDHLLTELDGTADKSNLGANTVYSVSIAIARAAAEAQGVPLYAYLSDDKSNQLPIPVFNLLNGGLYGDRLMEFQEFLLAPVDAGSYSTALRMGVEVFLTLGEVIRKHYGGRFLANGHSAGYAAPVNDPAEAVTILLEAVEAAGYENRFKIGLDCAASHFYNREQRCYTYQGRQMLRQELIQILHDLVEKYPIFMLEDPLDEDDFEGFAEITGVHHILVAGDDLFATDIQRLKRGFITGAGNAIILKPNMVGTISEAFRTAAWAKEHRYTVIPSIRSTGGNDDPIADIAVALKSPLIKAGAPRSGERVACHNRLLRIEETLGKSSCLAHFP
jgi:enolase